MDRASINQLAASDSSPSSRNIVLKASVTNIKALIFLIFFPLDIGVSYKAY